MKRTTIGQEIVETMTSGARIQQITIIIIIIIIISYNQRHAMTAQYSYNLDLYRITCVGRKWPRG